MTMEIGVFANITERSVPVDIVATALEARNVESLFVGEHTHVPVATQPDSYHNEAVIEFTKNYPAPWILLTAAAAVTKRLKVGTAICLIAQHEPLVFAKEIATLDMISRGRVILGCGYGWNRAELINHGIDPGRRRTALREKLQAVEMLWDQDIAEFSGEFVSFAPSWSRPKPFQRPRPPVFLGAPATPALFRDIVELADGWMPSARFTDEELAGQISLLRQAAVEAGRPAEELGVVLIEARATLSSPSIAHFIDHCPTAEQLLRWRRMGVGRVAIGVPTDTEEKMVASLDHLGDLIEQISTSGS